VKKKGPTLSMLVACLALLLSANPGAAQRSGHPVESRQGLQHDVSVVLKLIQVFVTDDQGNPVAGLGKSDFELFDDGERVKITEFENHVSATDTPKDPVAAEAQMRVNPKPSSTTAAPLMARKFIFLFDFAYNNPRGIVQAKAAARHFLETGLRPEDEAGVISVSMARGLAVHEYLTTRHDLVGKAVEAVSIKGAAGRADEIEEEYWRRQSEGNTNPVGRSPGGKSLFQLNAERQDSKAQASLILDLMTKLAGALRRVPGPKHILLFSTGLPESMLYGNRMNQHMVLLPGGRVLTVYDAGDSTLIRKNEIMLKEFAAANCSLYSFDTREAAMVQSLFTYDSQTLEEGHRNMFTQGGVSQNANQVFKDDKMTGQFPLRKAAGATGGEYFSNIRDYERSLARVQAMTDNYYVLGYQLDEQRDGRFHKIRVKVKTRGFTVRTQSGYYNPKPFRDYSDLEKRLHLVDLALSPAPDARIPVEPRMSSLVYTEGGESLVTLFTALSPEVMKSLVGRRVEFVSLIFDGQDKIARIDRAETIVSGDRDGQALHFTETTLGPGQYRCRLVLRDMESGESGVSSANLVIRERPALGLVVDTPLILADKKPSLYLGTAAGTRLAKWREHYGINAGRLSPIVGPSSEVLSTIFVALSCSCLGLSDPEVIFSCQLIDSRTGKEEPLPLLDEKTVAELDRIRKTLEFSTRDLRPGTYFFYVRVRDKASNAVAFAQTTLIIPSL
jgi:VWFA-related protein